MANKYRNVRTVVDGITFDSKAEAERYKELKLLQQAGEIRGFGLQPSFVVGPTIRYIPDFIVADKDGSMHVEDVKGVETPAFRLKKKLWDDKYGSWMPLVIVR